jgi:hypothetical protein
MSPQLAALLFVFGAAAIAIWIHVRFPALAPQDFRRGFLHLVLSTLFASFTLGPGLAAADLAGPRAGVILGVFGVCLPILVYCLIASIWLLRLASAMLPTR